jgi:hypothetical protein
MPVLLVLAMGVAEFGYLMVDQHVVTRVTREGSNLISRDTPLLDAATAMRSMSTRPINFDDGSKLIFSVIRRGATTGTNNYNKDILYQRYEIGALTAASAIKTNGAGNYAGAPDFEAVNADTDTRLQISNMPAGLVLPLGGMVYVTEIFSTHQRLTPLDRFGIAVPETLYSIAYF